MKTDLFYQFFNQLEMMYKSNNFIISNLVKDPESQEYCACTYILNDALNNTLKIIFRTAKITPKKTGQFVTLWKREGTGPIQPYDLSDPVDFFVINIADNKYNGQFIFPKAILFKKDILSKHGKGGKRAMRVYAPWDITESPQAKKTQAWQLDYFLDLSDSDHTTVHSEGLGKLYYI